MEKSNEKALKIVEQQYKSFADTVNWDFFRGLAQYIKTVQEMTPTKAIVEALEKQRELAIQPYMTLSTTSWEEFTKAGEEVIKMVKSINEQQEKYKIEMDDTMLQISQQMAGLLSTKDPLHFFNNNLLDVATKIKALGFGDTIKKFEDATKTNAYANYTFSPTYEKADYEKRTLERRQETEVWGAWFELPQIEKVVLEPEELNKQARKNLESTQSGKIIKETKPHLFYNFQTMPVQEMDLIRSGKKDAESAIFFKLSKYKDHAKRVHIYITTELIKSESSSEWDNDTLDFDDATSILSFLGEAITISARVQSDAHDLLRTIFKDRAKVWEVYEVIDDWGYQADEKAPKNKVYQAGKSVNRIVAQHTKVKDFLIITTKNVAINKAYLREMKS